MSQKEDNNCSLDQNVFHFAKYIRECRKKDTSHILSVPKQIDNQKITVLVC